MGPTVNHLKILHDRRTVASILLIVIVGVLAYSNTLHVPFYFDDDTNITDNPLVQSSDYFLHPSHGIYMLKYAEFIIKYIGYLSFALNYRIHGLDVRGYHIVNLVIHLIASLLVFTFVLLSFRTSVLSRSPAKDRAHFIALFSALLFVSHPVQTQAVTYIVQRLTSLATLFYMLSMVLYVKWRLLNEAEEYGNRDAAVRAKQLFPWKCSPWYLGALAAAILAMKTKEIAFTLPLVMTLYELLFFQGSLKKRVLALVPFALTMLIIPHAFLTYAADTATPIGNILEGLTIVEITRGDYLLTQFRVLVTYLRLLVLPVNQNILYDYPVSHTLFSVPVILSLSLLLAIISLGMYLAYTSRSSRSARRLAAFGIFWFFITLSVESTIVPLFPIYEHRVYLPSIGFFIAVTTLAFSLPDKFPDRKLFLVKTIVTVLALTVVILSGTTYARNLLWNDPVSFWADVIKKSPGQGRPHHNLASEYFRQGLLESAEKEYRASLSLEPGNTKSRHSLILLLIRLKRYAEAGREYEHLVSPGMDRSEAHYGLGSLFKIERAIEPAIKEYRAAISLDAGNIRAHYELGDIFIQQGLYDEAAGEFRAVLRMKPDDAEARNNLAGIYVQMGRYEDAVKELRTALRLNPGLEDVRYNLEYVLGQIRNKGK